MIPVVFTSVKIDLHDGINGGYNGFRRYSWSSSFTDHYVFSMIASDCKLVAFLPIFFKTQHVDMVKVVMSAGINSTPIFLFVKSQ